MKRFIGIILILSFVLAGMVCATRNAKVAQDKVFEMSCPATGCNFTNFVYYAPRQHEQNPLLQVLGIVAPLAAQTYMFVKQGQYNRDMHLSDNAMWTNVVGTTGNSTVTTSYTDSYNTTPTTTTTTQSGTFDSYNGDNRDNPVTTSTDSHNVDSVTVPPVTVVSPIVVPPGSVVQ